MVAFFSTLLRLFFQVFHSRRTILSEIALLKKENGILARKMGKKRVHFDSYDKLFLVVLNRSADINHRLTLVKPETVLSWQRNLIKRFWPFEHSLAKRGRKPVDAGVKDLILSMQNDNLLWGVKRIQGELLKLGISLSTKTIRKSFRTSGGEKRGAGQFPDYWPGSDRDDSRGVRRFLQHPATASGNPATDPEAW